MGDRKGTNKYYPPDFDYKKHSSINAYHGVHPLGDRAKKIKQGILQIRFEIPFSVVCDGCGKNLGIGTRFNAEKCKVGNYFSTKIWQFTFKCKQCPQRIAIRTDPKNADYVVESGGKRRSDPRLRQDERGNVLTEEGGGGGDDGDGDDDDDVDDVNKRADTAEDPFAYLEHVRRDATAAATEADRLSAIEERNRAVAEDDAAINSQLRRAHRERKRKAIDALRDGQRANLPYALLDSTPADRIVASAQPFGRGTAKDARDRLLKGSIFGEKKARKR